MLEAHGDEHDGAAGIRFAEHVLADRPALPVLVQSGEVAGSDVAKSAERIGAKFLTKGSIDLHQEIRNFVSEDMMFGPMKFQDGITGKELGAVSSVQRSSLFDAAAAVDREASQPTTRTAGWNFIECAKTARPQ